MTVGVPLPRGAVGNDGRFAFEDADGTLRPAQTRVAGSWPDGSVRWAVVDFRLDLGAERQPGALVAMRPGRLSPETGQIAVTQSGGVVIVETGAGRFEIARGGPFPLSAVLASGALDAGGSGLELTIGGRCHRCRVETVAVAARGPLRAEVEVTATVEAPLVVTARVEFFSGLPAVRASIAVRNSRRARHAGGVWPLGDPGSVFVDALEWRLAPQGGIVGAIGSVDRQGPPRRLELPLSILQASSGGANWASQAHVDRAGRVTLPFCGFEVVEGDRASRGSRAEPLVTFETAGGIWTVAVPEFWQQFPSGLALDATGASIGLWPRNSGSECELQGGEQKTHVVWIAFGPDPVATPALAWCLDPVLVVPDASWTAATEAIPGFTLMGDGSDTDESTYLALAGSALDPESGFEAKRERADEYGWRHWGDLPADHESVFQPADRPLVSHYNNQYDALASFIIHYLRTGDDRWWRLADPLARHVCDIDVYRTDEDKAAYNGGLFWHTNHHTDAGRSTHRTYPPGAGAGGGPSAEHNYNFGLMLHYFLTGDPRSRETAIGLGLWVLAMDDGARTPFRWLARGPTGLASASGSAGYHGPGRGGGNSILACLVADQLTGDPRFVCKADELIRRSVHPADDLGALRLFDTERRWFYTVFLQALGHYLLRKEERGELSDPAAFYARASLLHYGRWVADHERPYLDRPEQLEFPTETWAAQDLRKADLLWWAARYAAGDERARFASRARDFFRYAVTTLASMPTHVLTRPTVLLLGHGWRRRWFEAAPSDEAPAADLVVRSRPSAFVPQKARALRRGRAILGAAALAALSALGWWLA